MTLQTIDVDAPITLLDNTTWTFAQRSGSIVRLRSQADGSYRDFHIGDLSREVAGLPRSFAPSGPDFRLLPPKEKDRVEKLADHIEELLTGVNPSRPTVTKEKYAVTKENTQNMRVDAKRAEIGVSRATMMRYLKVYREQGALGLADPRTIRKYGPLANFDERVVEEAQRTIAANVKRSNVSKKEYIEDIEFALERHYGIGAVKTPSRATWYRLLDTLTDGKYTFDNESTKTKMSLANRPEAPFAKRQQFIAGAEVQTDSTTLDLFVRGPKGEPTRVVLTVMFDRATRMVIAHTFRLVAAKSVDHAMLVAQALTPRQNQPDRSEFRELIRRMNPGIPLMSEEERGQYVARAPFIRPLEVVIDNGQDFLGGAFRRALELHGIGVRFSAPHTPTSKPLVERNFGSISSAFLQHVEGYLGRSPEQRGYKVEKQKLLDIFGLHELFDDWLLKVWNHRPHGGLTDLMYPTVKLSPYQAYIQSTDMTSQLSATLTESDFIQLLPIKHHVISDTGVRMNGRSYDSPLLNSLRHTKSDNPRTKGKWEVHHDPYNATFVWVKGPDDQWIQCTSRDRDAIYEPFIESFDEDGNTHYDLIEDGEENARALVATIDSLLKGVPNHVGFAAASETSAIEQPPSTTAEEAEFDDTIHPL